MNKLTENLILLKKSPHHIIFSLFVVLAILALGTTAAYAQSETQYDIVLQGGRVIDPETNLDDIRNVGISDGRILEITTRSLSGKHTIDASGLVVSPGFIDLHVHGVTNVEQEYQVRDGVTSALELEWGVPMLEAWYKSRSSNALINYGASVNWAFCRSLDNPELTSGLEEIKKTISSGQFKGVGIILDEVRPALYSELSADQLPGMLEHVKESLREGGVGIGLVPAYVTGSSREEIYRIYQLAGEMQVPIFTHVREGGTMAIQQSISDAVITGAPLHIVHVNSMARSEIGLALEMIHAAQERGFDITTELYPYTAASTGIETALFDDGWQERLGISYTDIQWVATGERLTEKTFIEKRKEGGTVIIHMMKPEWIHMGIAADNVIIASDGMFYAKLAHPRTAGTFSRVLGKYVREEKVISLPAAIEKITLLPARRLETISPVMRFKGRIQVGADADITIFDPDKVIDRATFDEGLKFSEGIHYVLVNGVLVVDEGKTVKNVYPGQPIYGKFKQ